MLFWGCLLLEYHASSLILSYSPKPHQVFKAKKAILIGQNTTARKFKELMQTKAKGLHKCQVDLCTAKGGGGELMTGTYYQIYAVWPCTLFIFLSVKLIFFLSDIQH